MVKFVGEEKMTPVQLALETARFELSHLHGLRSFSPSVPESAWPSPSWPIDTTEAVRRINVALEWLNEEGRRTEPNTYP